MLGRDRPRNRTAGDHRSKDCCARMMNASAKIEFPTTAIAVSSVVAFLVSAVLAMASPDLFTLLLISVISVLPFAAILIVTYRLVRKRRIPLTTAAAVGLGLAIGTSSVLMGALFVRFVFPAHPPDEIRAGAQKGAAGNGSMVVCCEPERESLAVARA